MLARELDLLCGRFNVARFHAGDAAAEMTERRDRIMIHGPGGCFHSAKHGCRGNHDSHDKCAHTREQQEIAYNCAHRTHSPSPH
jgi:hypothetical protein